MKKLLLFAFAVAGFVIAYRFGILSVERPAENSRAQPESQDANSQAVSSVHSDQELRVAVANVPDDEPVPPNFATVEEALSDYWGANWAQVRQKAIEKGYESQLSIAPTFAPWEEVQSVFEQFSKESQAESYRESCVVATYIGMEPEMVLSLMQDFKVGYEATPEELDRLTELAKTYDDDLLSRIEILTVESDAVMARLWEEGKYSRQPQIPVGLDPTGDPESFHRSLAKIYGGWYFTIAIPKGYDQAFEYLRDDWLAARTEKFQALVNEALKD